MRKRGIEACERYIDWLPLTLPQLGTWPTTQACALSGNQTSNLSIHRPALNPLRHTSQSKVTNLNGTSALAKATAIESEQVE